MRRMFAIVAVAGGVVVIWRRNPRIGTTFVNSVVNPRLLGRGMAGGEMSEIGAIEHIGRRSGIRRLTPVHPESTPDGFRIVVPLGSHSEWAANVMAAGHCRLQLHEVVYDLDTPSMVAASDTDDLPWVIRSVMTALGCRYLRLQTFAAHPGALEPTSADAFAADKPRGGQAPAAQRARELVTSAQ